MQLRTAGCGFNVRRCIVGEVFETGCFAKFVHAFDSYDVVWCDGVEKHG